jgi:hypothetical protein
VIQAGTPAPGSSPRLTWEMPIPSRSSSLSAGRPPPGVAVLLGPPRLDAQAHTRGVEEDMTLEECVKSGSRWESGQQPDVGRGRGHHDAIRGVPAESFWRRRSTTSTTTSP